jgi:hypothetical protein
VTGEKPDTAHSLFVYIVFLRDRNFFPLKRRARHAVHLRSLLWFDGAIVNQEKQSCGEADGADGPPGALGMMSDFAEMMHHPAAEPASYQ